MAQQYVLRLLAVRADAMVIQGRAVLGSAADLACVTICLQLSTNAAVLEPARSFAVPAVAIRPERTLLLCLALAAAVLRGAGGNATLHEIRTLVVVAPEDGRRVRAVLARLALSKAGAGTVLEAGAGGTPRTGAGEASGHA